MRKKSIFSGIAANGVLAVGLYECNACLFLNPPFGYIHKYTRGRPLGNESLVFISLEVLPSACALLLSRRTVFAVRITKIQGSIAKIHCGVLWILMGKIVFQILWFTWGFSYTVNISK